MKTCSKCKEDKPLDEFYTKKTTKDGVTSQCKVCIRLNNVNQHKKQRVCKVCNQMKPLSAYTPKKHACNDCLTIQGKCSKCHGVFPLDQFHTNASKKSGRATECKSCHSILRKSREFGITYDEVKELFELWDNKCGICGSTENLCIDHNHNLPKGHPMYVRGLLCNSCNFGIGQLKDNKKILQRAIKYLEFTEVEVLELI